MDLTNPRKEEAIIMRPLILFDIDGVLVEPGGSRRLPNAAEGLARLRHGSDAVLSLLTADDEATARRRATATGVDRYLDFTVGAYGSDSASVAQDRARDTYGGDFSVIAVTADPTQASARAADTVVAVGPGPHEADHTVHSLVEIVEIVQLAETNKES
jgi:ribonucleotide monophosphatase NagD (HAD superfamily)